MIGYHLTSKLGCDARCRKIIIQALPETADSDIFFQPCFRRLKQTASACQMRFFMLGGTMETRVALIGIIVEDPEAAEKVNAILHEYGRWIIGRMGLPYRERKIHIISVVMDAPQDTISQASGKIGRLEGVTAKIAYAKMPEAHA
jgi:putative iron-only hydrogenase system regulator